MWASNPRQGGIISTHSRYRALLRREERYRKRFGNELVIRKKKVQEEVTEDPWALDPSKRYRATELEAYADLLLREDARHEVCRECGAHGDWTGEVEYAPQKATDKQGNPLVLEFKQLGCENEHTWWQGEGQVRGIGGDNPILFEEHLAARRRREIYTTQGTPDPEIVSGIYNRVHPQGRKVNSEEQRRKNGASFYR